MNVVLIALFHYENFALRSLFSYLRANGVPVSFIGFKRMRHKSTKTLKNDFMEMNDYHTEATEEDIDALLAQLEKLNPSLIGMGVQSSHFQVAQRITRAIKAKFPAPVIWGGSHPTIDPANCIPHTDMICAGEGFDPLLELSKRIAEGRPYDDIKNLWVNKGDRIIRNEMRPLLNDLDILPFASYDGEHKSYIDDGRLQPDRNIDYFGYGFTDDPLKTIHQTMTSFGCLMNCSFCVNALTHEKFRRRSVSRVIGELVGAKRKNPGLKMVFFWDNIFQVNKKWCLEFAREYREKVNIPFFAYSHPSYVDEEILVALREAGWTVTVMGIQSGSYAIRKQLYNRSELNSQVITAGRRLDGLRSIKRSNGVFRIYYDYVKNNILEKREDLRESLNLFLQLPKNFIFQAFNLSFFPNYVLTKIYLAKGFITEKDIEGNTSTSGSDWITTFDSKKEYRGFLRTHEYYYLLFSLAQFKIFPNFLIRQIEKRELFFNHLHLLHWICRVVRFTDLYFSPSNYRWLWGILSMVSLRSKIRHRVWVRLG
ncbi:MAG: cobalamin-dependent protein [Candidatus Aureabacteria bacterium]|nr:cobalamin-dependent protein [Candidatus Auribacterota bacterium]